MTTSTRMFLSIILACQTLGDSSRAALQLMLQHAASVEAESISKLILTASVPQTSAVENALAALDTDGDHRITVAEIEHYAQSSGIDLPVSQDFDKLDRDGDGALDLAELSAGLALEPRGHGTGGLDSKDQVATTDSKNSSTELSSSAASESPLPIFSQSNMPVNASSTDTVPPLNSEITNSRASTLAARPSPPALRGAPPKLVQKVHVQSHEEKSVQNEAVVSVTSAAPSAFTAVGVGNNGVAKSQRAAQLIRDALETVQNESRAATLLESKVAELRSRAASVEKIGKRTALAASENASNTIAYELLSNASRLQAQARDAEIKAAESLASAKAFALEGAMYETLAKQAGLELGMSESKAITSPAANAASGAE